MTAVQQPAPTHPAQTHPAPTGAAHTPSRRVVVSAVGAAGLAAVLAACGDSDDQTPQPGEDTTGGTGEGEVLAPTSDIPEGGGTVFKEQGVVVTQPTAGEFKAFSSTCTHQGCTVRDVAEGTINCPCHGSRFDLADGSVAAGPAPRPLPATQITVEGDSIRLA
ncbi:Rieske (2Fe-2S) protein [Streptomyces apocyni]|uniref:Rieske (2Fe-2S) protein n=1 Tax=Streptomyces apocyni TaxID=2654677 RepID=UPI0012EA5671|nr:Rieske (2Fe-2S) protein [Streptomyces apocyni]